MDAQIINEIFSRLAKANPTPKSELNYINSYTFLVAVALSAQSTDAGVNKATVELFKVVTTPQQMIALGEEGLKRYIKTIGLFKSKAKNILGASIALIERFNSEVPSSLKELISLPGIGIKSAKVVLNTIFHKPDIPVDRHVFRVSHRIGLSSKSSADKLCAELEEIIPDKWKMHAADWLVLHGRYTCKARRPLCEKCPISDLCKYYEHHFGV